MGTQSPLVSVLLSSCHVPSRTLFFVRSRYRSALRSARAPCSKSPFRALFPTRPSLPLRERFNQALPSNRRLLIKNLSEEGLSSHALGLSQLEESNK